MNMKIFSCYSSGEGFYSLLNDNLSLVFLNVVYPCSIKDLYKAFALKKDYNLKVVSVKSFIKLAALRDNQNLLSFFYPRGFVLITSIEKIIGITQFQRCEEVLKDIGEIVAIKPFANVILTVDFWKTSLKYGVFLNYNLILKLLINLIFLALCFNYFIVSSISIIKLYSNDNV